MQCAALWLLRDEASMMLLLPAATYSVCRRLIYAAPSTPADPAANAPFYPPCWSPQTLIALCVALLSSAWPLTRTRQPSRSSWTGCGTMYALASNQAMLACWSIHISSAWEMKVSCGGPVLGTFNCSPSVRSSRISADRVSWPTGAAPC